MSADPPAQAQVSHADPPTANDVLPTHRLDFSAMSASARTSFTRVDMTAGQDEDSNNEQEEGEGQRVESSEEVQAEAESVVPQTPQVSLTFLTVSGRRRSMSFDPEITIGRAKELVWNAWPNEWQDERPPAPSYLRILYLGKILQDEDTLTKVGFPTHIPPPATGHASSSSATPPLPTVVHLSIRSCPPTSTKDMPKKKGARGSSSGEEAEAAQRLGCCAACVVC